MTKRQRLSYIYKLKKRCKIEKKNKSESDSDSDSDSDSENNNLKKVKNNINIDIIDNHIWFNDEISNKSISYLVKLIHIKNSQFLKQSRKILFSKIEPLPIYLHINSDGGDLMEVMAAVDAVINSKIPIYTIIEGCAASAATLLSIVGKRRYITENSHLLIHEISSSMWGKMSELEDNYENNKKLTDRLLSLYTEYSNLTKKQLKVILKHDIWWDSATCIKNGLVDDIYKGDN